MTSRIALWTVALLRGPFSIRRLAVLTLVFATLAGAVSSRQATAQNVKPLSEVEVLELLSGAVSSKRIAALADEKGIDFEITPDIRKKLREAGATPELIEALVKARKGNKEEAKPQSGNLKVKTKPGEAQVYLSDEFKGMTSPEGELRVPSIPPGDYRLRVSKAAYQTWEDEVTVSSGETQTVFVTLDQTSSESIAEKPTLPRSATEPLEDSVSPAVPALRPIRVKLAPTVLRRLVLRANDYLAVTFKVEPAMQQARVVGRFTASGGTNNDIMVLLFNQDGFRIFNPREKRRKQPPGERLAHALYNTGKITNGQINAPLSQAGTYYLVFSNIFSLISAKNVSAEVELRYLAAQ